MVTELVLVTFGGLLGGWVRGTVGVLKAVKMGRRLSARYLITTLIASALIGMIAGLFVENDMKFSILAGYVGTDFIESLYKVRFRERYKPSKRKVRIP